MHPNGQSPPGAYSHGTKLTVGSHQVQIKSYISEGGFAHVYVVEASPPDFDGTTTACLKRVAVPDKIHLNLLRAEVDAMKRLRGHTKIVRYIDSHAARMGDGSAGYEVFLLMEYCSGNGLIDFMNTRLRDQLTEPEILQIMYDITSGLAAMHYLEPPLIHRDLKIENVLISADGTYKLCDFGSVSPVLRPPKNSQEFHILEEDIQRHTTAQYRSPEMIDIYRGFPIDEKCDIWALGVFLYKLCYYTTPFEKEGQLAILHARFEFLPKPIYSDRLKRVISALLREDPRNRPNVYQVLKEISSMRGLECPIADKYSIYKQQPAPPPPQQQGVGVHNNFDMQTPSPAATPMVVSTPSNSDLTQKKTVPEVTPMYRGRPTVKNAVPAPTYENMNDTLKQQQQHRGSSAHKSHNAVFTDPFALLDSGGADTPSPKPPSTNYEDEYQAASSKYPTVEELTRNLEQKSFSFEPTPVQSQNPSPQPPPTKPKPSLVQQRQILFDGANSGKEQSPPQPQPQEADANGLRYMDNTLSSSSSGSSYEMVERPSNLQAPSSSTRNKGSVSSPTLEHHNSYSNLEKSAMPPPLPRRSHTTTARRRPVSMYVQSVSGSLMDLDEATQTPDQQQLIDTSVNDERDELKNFLTGVSQHSNTVVLEGGNHHIDSNVDFLKALDNEPTHYSYQGTLHKRTNSQSQRQSSDGAAGSWKLRRSGSAASGKHHRKRSSISSLKGKLNDAFKSGGGGNGGSGNNSGNESKRSSLHGGLGGRFSYSTESLGDLEPRPADFGYSRGGSMDIPRNKASPPQQYPSPPIKSSATIAEPASKPVRGNSLIQNRINSFLNRTESPPPKKTASGYGKYTDDGTNDDTSDEGEETITTTMLPPASKSAAPSKQPPPSTTQHGRQLSVISSTSSNSSTGSKVPPTRPAKPSHLKSPPKRKDEDKAPPLPIRRPFKHERKTSTDSEDWEAKFNQKYPSLG